jgi:hypothetical protein
MHNSVTAMPADHAGKRKRALQFVVALCSLVPITAGAGGMLFGPCFFETPVIEPADLDGHFRYLSGLLLGIGIAYLLAIPGIERQRKLFLLLGAVVVLGGLGRLFGMLTTGAPTPFVLFALAMELIVTPVITLWQARISQQAPS